MSKLISRFLRDENGATAIEYGLIAALVAVAAMGAIGTMGEAVTGVFTDVATKLNGTSTP
jgi:pilus assembly protein Flp/PilA